MKPVLRPARRLAPALTLPLALAAGCSEPLAPSWDALARAETRWSAAGLDDYEMVYAESCFCAPAPRRIVVRDGVVTLVEPAPPGDEQPDPTTLEGYTVEQLFDRVRQELGRDPYRARTEFDDALGHPVDIWFDYEKNAIDEEWGFTITAFQALD